MTAADYCGLHGPRMTRITHINGPRITRITQINGPRMTRITQINGPRMTRILYSNMTLRFLSAAVFLVISAALSARAATTVVGSEFIYETASFPSAHASTIVSTSDGLVAAWFGGTREGADEVGIWSSRQVKGTWTAPVEVATGQQPDGERVPCWNPVLFQKRDGTLLLFYKVGPSPRAWWGMVRSSADNGRTWADAQRLPDGILGPIKNKPVQLADGTILSGSSTESSDTPSVWRVHFERSVDDGRTWTRIEPALGQGDINAIQPSILVHSGNRLQALGRTRSGRLFETWSDDNGKSWSALTLLSVPNPNSGIDAVTLRDGRHVLVYNRTPQGRTPLNVAISADGKAWEDVAVLEKEPGEYSYPAVIQAADGLVHITYTWKRQRIKHVVLDLAR
jgi:predicted neuraminidase